MGVIVETRPSPADANAYPRLVNYSLRPVTVGDRPAVRDVIVAANLADGVPQVVTLDEVEEDLDDNSVVLATDARVAVDGESGAVVGYAFCHHIPSEVVEERVYVFGDVHPDWRRQGIGGSLLGWGKQRAEQQLRSATHDLPKYIRVDGYDYCAADHALFASQGFAPVRYFEELLRPLDDLPPEPAADAIAGLRIVPWSDERSEDIRIEKNTAFGDHWGSTPNTPESWSTMTTGHGSYRECSFFAVDDDDRVVAHCFNSRYSEDDESLGRRDGWITSLGTLREWRGRGVATALIDTSLHAFARAGLTHASIGVDSANPSGANELYRRLGFESNQRSITHQIQIA
jgi:ribosomal protein S18 acetylase RimI-like enzyme